MKKRPTIVGIIETDDPYKVPRKSDRKLFPVGTGNTQAMAVEMLREGHTAQEIVDEIGCSWSVVKKAKEFLRKKR